MRKESGLWIFSFFADTPLPSLWAQKQTQKAKQASPLAFPASF